MTEIHTSDQIDQIADAMAKAQAALENVSKSGKNPHFKSSYATLADVLSEVRPKFAAEGIAIVQMPVNGEGSNIGVATRFAHKSGQWIESVIFVAPTKFDAQGVGSVQSYLRRYSLMAMAAVGGEDDDGEAAVGRPALPQPRPTRPAPAPAGEQTAAPPSQPPVNGNGHQAPPTGDPKERARVAGDRIERALNEAVMPKGIDAIVQKNTGTLDLIHQHDPEMYDHLMRLASIRKTEMLGATG
jgi:hypothetical protein